MIKITSDVRFICEKLIELFSPEKLILFGEKFGAAENEVVDIDICMVAPFDSAEKKKQAIRTIYLEIESKIPYDIFLYTPEEWETLTSDTGSFASRIVRKGHLYYGEA